MTVASPKGKGPSVTANAKSPPVASNPIAAGSKSGAGGRGKDTTAARFPWLVEVFQAWCKDTEADPNEHNQKKFQDIVNGNCTPQLIKLRRLRLGELCGVALSKSLKDITSIEKLDLTGNPLRDLGAMALINLLKSNPNITHVSIGSSDIGSEGSIAFARELRDSNRLVSLDLGNDSTDSVRVNRCDGVAGIAFAQALTFNTSLTALSLNRVGLGTLTNNTNDPKQEAALCLGDMLKTNTTLQTLRLARNHFGSMGVVLLLQSLQVNSGITQLDLSFNRSGPEVALVMTAALKANRVLKELNLNGNPIGSVGTAALAQALGPGGNDTLQVLHLSNVGMKDRGATQLLEALIHNPQVSDLSIANNGLTGAVGSALCECVGSRKAFKHLDLSRNPLGDKALTLLAEGINTAGSLVSLECSGVKMGDLSASKICKVASHLESLTSLKLNDNFVSDHMGILLVETLARGSPVFEVDLTSNQLGHSTLLQLQRVCVKHRDDSTSREPRMLMKEIKRLRAAEKRLRETEFQLQRMKTARAEAEKVRAAEEDILLGLREKAAFQLGKANNDIQKAQKRKEDALAAAELKREELLAWESKTSNMESEMEHEIDNENQHRERIREQISLVEEQLEKDRAFNVEELKVLEEALGEARSATEEVQEATREVTNELRTLERSKFLALKEVREREKEAAAKAMAEAEEAAARRAATKKGKGGAKGKGKKGKK